MIRLRVKELAQARGMSQRELARRSGLHVSTVRRIFQNPHTITRLKTLGRLADALQARCGELIESEREP